MHVSPSSSPRMAKSTSLGVLDHDHADMHIVEQEDIIGLTQDVKNFSDNLARLKALFTEPWEIDEDLKVLAHERLGEVLCTLKSVLQRYPPLNTTELFSAAGTLISKIKNYSYDDHNCDGVESAFNDAIDQLALEFSSSVSEYLMGDLQHSFSEDVKTKSYDNLLSMSSGENEGTEDEKEEPVVRLTSEEIDGTLMKLQAGLELAFQRAKAWSKYLKDVMAYIERRAQLEVEYAKNLSRLASSVKPVLTEEGFLPLQSVYCTVLSQDVEYSKTCQATFTLLQTSKFIEPLTGRRNEYDKVRKTVKDTWNKEVKKMQESVNNLRKAQTLYVTRKQEYAKARELAAKTETDMLSHSASTGSITTKMDKKKRAEDDALHKAAEAETTYKACVAEANSRQTDIQKTKHELLAMLREQILLSDQAIKKATIEYFQLLQTVSAPVPVQYNTLCESTKRYEPGSQYGEFVRRLPITTFETLQYEEFKFEPYSYKIDPGVRKPSTQSIDSASSDHQSGEGSPSPRRSDKYRTPLPAWSGGKGIVSNSDTDSHSGSSKSVDSSPSASPYPAPGNKRLALSSSMDDLIEDNRDMPSGVKQLLAVPGTEQMDVNSLVKRQGQRRGTTFGVDFQEQVEHYHSAIPPIISKCLKEVEKRGINVKGIYRVSGVKSTVESLCQRFEMDPESVTLDTENPNVISNVLKLYLRQLPEPLLTFRLYQNFIQVAKENMSGGLDMDHTVEHFHDLIDRLPFSNRKTCGVLMHHLKRVASHAEYNQMNSSNLGIVFGPTLLRPQGGNASLACLVDTPHQTRVVELLIVNAENLFGPMEDHQLIPGETAIETMKKPAQPVLLAPQPATIELTKDHSPKHDLKKEKSPVVTLKSREDLIPPPASSPRDSPRDSQPHKSTDILLPGSASFERKEGSSQLPSDGEAEGSVTSLGDEGAESDGPSDDEIFLPDDSHRSRHAVQHVEQTGAGGGALMYMTPPLSPRHSTYPRLTSPASSPNLSSRSAPPTITVEDSPATQQSSSSGPDLSTIQQKVLQLPPVNTWYPKGESMFNSILDSRSPQVYRRTPVTGNSKTASYPQSNNQACATQGSSRVSWPQRSQDLKSSEENLSPPMLSVTTDNSDKYASEKSPKLLRKCTSFDMERSRPFPARSMISSPIVLRKVSSLDDSEQSADHSTEPTPNVHNWAYTDTENELSKIVHREEDESLEFPHCESVADTTRHNTISAAIADSGYHEFVTDEFDTSKINESLEDPNIPETDILDDFVSDFEAKHTDMESETDPLITTSDLRKPENYLKDKNDQPQAKISIVSTGSEVLSSLSELGAKPKTKKASTNSGVTKVSKTKTKSDKAQVSASPKLLKSKSESGPIPGKSEKTTEKQKHRSSTSTVKSALLSSAAKIKAISRKSPVMLLSYKSHSISIPDDTDEPYRLTSGSVSSSSPRPKKGTEVHHTESSPEVLMTTISPKTKSSTKPLSKNSPSSSTSSKSSAPKAFGLRKTSSEQSKSSGSDLKKPTRPSVLSKGKEKFIKTQSTKDVPSPVRTPTSKSALAKSYTCERQGTKSSVSSASKSILRSSLSGSAATKTKSDPTKIISKTDPECTKGDPKIIIPRMQKRGSVSSVNSDSSKKSDHFRDCCHGRRRNTEKK